MAGENVLFSRPDATGNVARREVGGHLCEVDWGREYVLGTTPHGLRRLGK